MIKIHPSSATFMTGDLVYTDYSSGCLRSLLLASKGIREPFDEKHSKRGAINEEIHEKHLKENGVSYEREVPFQITLTDDVYISGRIDFLLPDRIRELKSTESVTVIREVIKNGKLKLGNVAQTVIYMMAKNLSLGELIYTGYKFSEATQEYRMIAERVFNIALEADGKIKVDGRQYEFTAQEALDHILAHAGVIRDNRIASRPYSHASFDGPCRFCPFSDTCGLYDGGILGSLEEFVDSATNELQRKGKK